MLSRNHVSHSTAIADTETVSLTSKTRRPNLWTILHAQRISVCYVFFLDHGGLK